MNDTLVKFAGGQASIQSFGTNNPKVAAFLNATFALESLGSLREANANEVNAQSIGNGLRDSGISLG
jgi:hypothetical protein